MKLFTIGDSVSQGYMSAAAARTDLAYSTLIARKMGLDVKNEYTFPTWKVGGLPANLEKIMRRLERHYDNDINSVEWFTVLPYLNNVLDEAEDYYERGEGRHDVPYHEPNTYFHNIAIQGFTVADAWKVTPELCLENINKSWTRDQFLGIPDNDFYRIALKVLNPSLDRAYMTFSQLSWLDHHVQNDGVENLCLWLGANNALRTVITLRINQTVNDSQNRPSDMSHSERKMRNWNLWHPTDFRIEYEQLLEKVHESMSKNGDDNWKVFIGTVPQVTIAPIAKGVGETTHIVDSEGDKGWYYKYYTWFPFEEAFAINSGIHLTIHEALHIDKCISEYNATINALVDDLNKKNSSKQHYFVVDLAKTLREMAWKRNNGHPTYDFPDFFTYQYPSVNTKYYHADSRGRLRQGGLFSLDGVHPTAIGQGLIAHEFLEKMNEAGVVVDTELDWGKIFASDMLYTQPISLMQEIYQHEKLAGFFIKLFEDRLIR
ncbi:MAG: hypothetical protein GY943_15305 [Chloroflexi bacterium]|nr:hypothetical protein [Chloroflexota bacterium]